jgi:hypothetical protein
MAINYLNNVNFNRNELQDAQLIRSQVENQPNDAAVGGTPVEGQLYFNTTSDVLKIYGNGSWSEVGGGVETLTTTDGTYIDLTPNSATAGAVTVTADLSAVDGTAVAATRFLSKDNTWDVPAFPTPPTVNNGTLTMTTSAGLDGGTQTFSANQAGNTTFAVSLDLNELPAGGTLIATDSIIALNGTTESKQLISAIPLSIFNNDLPTASNATITLAAGDILDGGGAFTLNQSANETITFDLAEGGAGAAVYGSTSNAQKIDNITLDAYGRVTLITTGATGQVNTVVSGNTATLSHTGTINKTLTPVTAAVNASSAALATGAQIATAISTALTGVLQFQGTWNASTNSPTLTSSVGTSGDYYIVSVAGSTNLNGITDWEIGDWAVFANTTWTKIDNSQVGDVTGDGTAGRVAFWNSGSNITNDAGFTYNSTSNAFGVSGVITASGGNSGEWNSGYDNMITGFSDSGSGTITLTLTQQDGGTLTTSFANPQGTMSSWNIKEGNGTESTAVSNGETLTIAQGTGIQSEMTSTSSGGTITITNTDRGSSQNIFKNVASSSGTAVADNNNDTLTVVGAGGISTAVSGDTLTITSSNGTNSDYTKVGSIAAGDLFGTVTHAFGINTIVQTIDSSGNTVYCEVSRTSTTSVATISVAQATAITILVQKIG